MTKADTLSTRQRIDQALQIASELSRKNPADPMAKSVVDQLQFLKKAIERDGNLKSVPPGKMTIGMIAAREYDTSHPQLAALLYDIDWEIDHPPAT